MARVVRPHWVFLILLMGVTKVQGYTSDTFNPPFSSRTYSCRCLPMRDMGISSNTLIFNIHRRVCEFKSYLQTLQPHAQFIFDAFSKDTTSAREWFAYSGRRMRSTLSGEISHILNHKNSKLTSQQQQELLVIMQHLENNDFGDGRLQATLAAHKQVGGKSFLTYLYDLGSWLLGMDQTLQNQSDDVAVDIAAMIKELPLEEIAEKTRTPELKAAVCLLAQTGSVEGLQKYWADLKDFADRIESGVGALPVEQEISYNYVCLKDFADLLHVLQYGIANKLQEAGIAMGEFGSPQRFFVFNLFTIYDKVNALHIEEILDSICRFVKKFNQSLTQLQKESETNFEGWLQSKWITLPLAVGVIIVKVAKYFLESGNSGPSTSYSGFGSSNFGSNSVGFSSGGVGSGFGGSAGLGNFGSGSRE